MKNTGLILLMIFVGFPALEIYATVTVADYIGWWTLLWLILSALAGWLLIKEESVAIFGRIMVAMQNGQTPFSALWDSGRTFLAGGLLIFPGVLSDVIALILLLLPNRSEQPAQGGYETGSFEKGRFEDDGIIEGEGRIVEVERIEVRKYDQ